MKIRTAAPAGIALAAIATLILAAACGGGDGGPPPVDDETAATVTQPSDLGFSEEEAREAAEQALLRLEDFPTGWIERPAEEEEGPKFELPPEWSIVH